MERERARTGVVLALSLLAAASACRRETPPSPDPSASADPSAAASTQPPAKIKPAATSKPPLAAASARVVVESPETDSGALDDAPWLIDELGDIGPAGPATACSKGVALVTQSDNLVLAKLGALPTTAAAAACTVQPVDNPAGQFLQLGRAPATLGDFAYWISRGRLLRGQLGTSKTEVLARDARDNTTVAVAPSDGTGPRIPPAVAFVARSPDPKGPLVAKLWVEGAGVIPLTAEGAASNSVALVRTPSGLMALSLEGRSGMSPIHAREIAFDTEGKPALGDDVVAWVGGRSQPMTQITAVVSPSGDVFGLVPLERDISTFGLATIRIGQAPQMNANVAWRDYPNGIDPAPLATGRLCGASVAAYARPAEARPGSPQELRLAEVLPEGLGPSVVLARSRAFSTISIAELPKAALIAYVADRRTWARTIRCRSSKK